MYKEVELYSKRNTVYRVYDGDTTYIKKEYTCNKNQIIEEEMLDFLMDKGVLVPKIMSKGNRYLLLEDLGETTLLDWFERAESENLNQYDEIVYNICDFLKSFYTNMKDKYGYQMSLYDMNFRNFILVNNKIYRVDFEETKKGSIEQDLGKLLAFSTMYDPPRTTWKLEFKEKLLKGILKEFSLREDELLEEEEKELQLIRKRRKNK